MEHTRKLRRWGGFLLLLVLLVTFLIWNLLAGSVRLPASEIWAILHGGGDLTQALNSVRESSVEGAEQ